MHRHVGLSTSSSESPQRSDQLPPEQVSQGTKAGKCSMPFMTSLQKFRAVNAATFSLPHRPDSV